jgi:hypothetical protein
LNYFYEMKENNIIGIQFDARSSIIIKKLAQIMKQLFFYLGVFLTLTACKKSENAPKAVNSDAEITQKINQMYSVYGKSSEAMYDNPFSDTIFSSGLKKTLDEAVKASNEDIEKVKKSAHPEDKPQVFEGSVFTSLYEGYTTYKILSVKMIDGSNPAKSEVSVEFENSKETPKITWTDKVNLINSGNGWKIDNINFDKKITDSDLKKSLKAFMEGAKTTK